MAKRRRKTEEQKRNEALLDIEANLNRRGKSLIDVFKETPEKKEKMEAWRKSALSQLEKIDPTPSKPDIITSKLKKKKKRSPFKQPKPKKEKIKVSSATLAQFNGKKSTSKPTPSKPEKVKSRRRTTEETLRSNLKGLSREEVIRLAAGHHGGRTPRAIEMDNKRAAKITYGISEADYKVWKHYDNTTDLDGIDSPDSRYFDRPKKKGDKMPKKTKRSIRSDRKKRSKEPWERGKKAPKKGNPRYKPVRMRDKKGNMRTVYKIRKR